MVEPIEPAEGASVLLAFRAENARSFRDPVEISLLATAMAEPSCVRQVQWREGGSPIAVLPAAALFGANASGKSNALRLMDDMRSLVLTSFRQGDPSGGMPRQPFLLDDEARQRPTRFEIDVVVQGVRHEYGLTFDDHRVLTEWAYRYPKGRAALLFERELDEVTFGGTARQRSRAVLDLLRPNALYLSTAASANHPTLLPLFEWFSRNLLLAEVETRDKRQAFTAQLLEGIEHKPKILALLRAADLGITGATTQEPDLEDVHLERRSQVALSHQGANGDVEFHPNDESLGTMIWFGLVGPVVDVLERGAVLLADELDASLHPALVHELVRIFQNPRTNPKRAQLIFNSHDVTLLGDATGERPLGRDQVWFAEKLHDGSTRLYPLTDLDPRKQEAIGKRYLEGRYGGVPIVSRPEFEAAAELIASAGR